MAAKEAIEEWIGNNVTTQQSDIAAGYRFKLFAWLIASLIFLSPLD